MKYYHYALDDQRYSFLYIDAQDNPARFYRRHEMLIGIGDKPQVDLSVKDIPEPFEKK